MVPVLRSVINLTPRESGVPLLVHLPVHLVILQWPSVLMPFSAGQRSIAMGASSSSLGEYSIALGRYASSGGMFSLAGGQINAAGLNLLRWEVTMSGRHALLRQKYS